MKCKAANETKLDNYKVEIEKLAPVTRFIKQNILPPIDSHL